MRNSGFLPSCLSAVIGPSLVGTSAPCHFCLHGLSRVEGTVIELWDAPRAYHNAYGPGSGTVIRRLA
jgi:hypothetical protein